MPPRMRTRSAGRPAAESLGGGTGERVSRGGRGRRPREGNDERVDELNGQGNGLGMGANGGVEGANGNVGGANGGAPDFPTIIAQQLRNLLPAMLAQLDIGYWRMRIAALGIVLYAFSMIFGADTLSHLRIGVLLSAKHFVEEVVVDARHGPIGFSPSVVFAWTDVRRIEFAEYVVLFGRTDTLFRLQKSIRCLSRRFDTSYPTGGYDVSGGLPEQST
ncbi:hypothetical protein Tco_1220728 [Tanacetum coccineum]